MLIRNAINTVHAMEFCRALAQVKGRGEVIGVCHKFTRRIGRPVLAALCDAYPDVRPDCDALASAVRAGDDSVIPNAARTVARSVRTLIA